MFVHLEFWGFSIFHSHTFIQTSVSPFFPTFEKIWTEMRVAGGHKATALVSTCAHGRVCVCEQSVYRWPQSPEGATALLTRRRFVLH